MPDWSLLYVGYTLKDETPETVREKFKHRFGGYPLEVVMDGNLWKAGPVIVSSDSEAADVETLKE